jgi:hypothetical protein
MSPKKLRPAAPGRARRPRNSKELGGTFDPKFSEVGREPQDNTAPIARTQFVVGRRASFLYIARCPLCHLEHAHGFFVHGNGGDPLAALAGHGGVRMSHCHCQGPARVARRARRGGWRTVVIGPTDWREPHGYHYRLVLSEPACFTARGIRSPAARRAMIAFARKGVATSLTIWTPQRSSFRGWGDR